ncbi:hypothetical protein DFH09DRAFT_1327064 [Mycena vulgaris]|nr:hypothetical protein DFH09DRAFT_1327064 [Mycena vulgaris]
MTSTLNTSARERRGRGNEPAAPDDEPARASTPRPEPLDADAGAAPRQAPPTHLRRATTARLPRTLALPETTPMPTTTAPAHDHGACRTPPALPAAPHTKRRAAVHVRVRARSRRDLARARTTPHMDTYIARPSSRTPAHGTAPLPAAPAHPHPRPKNPTKTPSHSPTSHRTQRSKKRRNEE